MAMPALVTRLMRPLRPNRNQPGVLGVQVPACGGRLSQMPRLIMHIVIDGREVDSEAAFHRIAARLLDFGPYYGRNLDALWDRLSRDVPRPVLLTWTHAADSRRAMGEAAFNGIVDVLAAAQAEDAEMGMVERFRFEVLEDE